MSDKNEKGKTQEEKPQKNLKILIKSIKILNGRIQNNLRMVQLMMIQGNAEMLFVVLYLSL